MAVIQMLTGQDGHARSMSKRSSILITSSAVYAVVGGDPPVGGEQADGEARPVHGNGDQVAEGVVALLHERRLGLRHRVAVPGHALFPQEGVEVAVFAFPMGVVVVLRVGLEVVDIARRVVVVLIEGALVAEHLGDHVGVALLQHAVAF